MKLFKFFKFFNLLKVLAIFILSINFSYGAIDLVEEDEDEPVKPKVEINAPVKNVVPKKDVPQVKTLSVKPTIPAVDKLPDKVVNKATEVPTATKVSDTSKVTDDSLAVLATNTNINTPPAQMSDSLIVSQPSANVNDSLISDSTDSSDSTAQSNSIQSDSLRQSQTTKATVSELDMLKSQLEKQQKEILALQRHKEEEEDNVSWKKRFLWQTPLVVGLFVLGFLMGGGHF